MYRDERRATATTRKFWQTAKQQLENIGVTNFWERLQALQLLAHYGFLNPKDVDGARCSAAATRLSLELGLQHELRATQELKLSRTALNHRRRLFWHSYSIDS